MDQYSCYLGGLIHVYPENYPGAPSRPSTTRLQQKLRIPYGVERLSLQPRGFILIDSGQPKDTQGVLSSVGARARGAVAAVQAAWAGFDLRTARLEDFDAAPAVRAVDAESRQVVRDHLINRDLCVAGLALLRTADIDADADSRLGALLNEEHRVLADTLGISTPRIDGLQRLCNANGARGGKINGSGGGGTLFCYAREQEDRVSAALTAAGARHFRVNAALGARIL
jgi:galactokinase